MSRTVRSLARHFRRPEYYAFASIFVVAALVLEFEPPSRVTALQPEAGGKYVVPMPGFFSRIAIVIFTICVIEYLKGLFGFFGNELLRARFRGLFGPDAGRAGLSIVVPVFQSAGGSAPGAVSKQFAGAGPGSFSESVAGLTALADVQAAAHLVALFESVGEAIPDLQSDHHSAAQDVLDVSFIAVGLFSNEHTYRMLRDRSNTLFDLTPPGSTPVQDRAFWLKSDAQMRFAAAADGKMDHAIIVRLTPADAPERRWVLVGGVKEQGTKAAAEYLRRHWRSIAGIACGGKPIGERDFAIVLRVPATGRASVVAAAAGRENAQERS